MKTLGSFLLSLLALILFMLMAPIGVLWGLFALFLRAKFSEGWQKLGRYLMAIAISIDQLGNVVCAELFNDIMIFESPFLFGNPDETISSVLGKNKQNNTLTGLGRFLDRLLHLFDPMHTEKSIEH